MSILINRGVRFAQAKSTIYVVDEQNDGSLFLLGLNTITETNHTSQAKIIAKIGISPCMIPKDEQSENDSPEVTIYSF